MSGNEISIVDSTKKEKRGEKVIDKRKRGVVVYRTLPPGKGKENGPEGAGPGKAPELERKGSGARA